MNASLTTHSLLTQGAVVGQDPGEKRIPKKKDNMYIRDKVLTINLDALSTALLRYSLVFARLHSDNVSYSRHSIPSIHPVIMRCTMSFTKSAVAAHSSHSSVLCIHFYYRLPDQTTHILSSSRASKIQQDFKMIIMRGQRMNKSRSGNMTQGNKEIPFSKQVVSKKQE